MALIITAPSWWIWTDPRYNLSQETVDDAKNHLLRLYHLIWLIDHGVWYPRWVPDMFMGYGYPLFTFYAPGIYYLGWALHALLRFDVWDSYRGVGVLAALVGTAGIYLLAVALWRRVPLGILAAVALLYGPYFIPVDIFRRGDLPEALGIALLPWLLLGLWRLWRARTRAGAAAGLTLSVTAGAAVILTHNLSALMAGTIAAVWVGWLVMTEWSAGRLARVVLAGALVLACTAFFWLPSVGESRLVHLEQLWSTGGLDYHGWFIETNGQSPRIQDKANLQTRTGPIDLHLRYPNQLVAPPKISLAQAGLGTVALASLAFFGGWRSTLPPLLAVAGVCWFLTFAISEPVWSHVPGLPLLQFPWRLFGPLCVCLALAGAGALARPLRAAERRWPRWREGLAWGVPALLGGLVVFNGTGYRYTPLAEHPKRVVDGRMVVQDEVKDTVGVGSLSNLEFLPKDVQVAVYTVGTSRVHGVFERLFPEPDWLGGLFTPLGGDLRFLGWHAGPLSLSVRVANDAPTSGEVGVRQLAFAGWRAWLDGKRVPIKTPAPVPEQQSSLGFIVLEVPPGEHVLNLAYGLAPLPIAGTMISAAALVAAALVAGIVGARQLGGARGVVAIAAAVAVSAVVAFAVWRGLRPAFGRFAASPAEPAAAQAGVWRAPAGASGSALIVNIAEAARANQARAASPAGGNVGNPFLHVQQLTVGDGNDAERGWPGSSRREWLYMHPPSSVSVDVAVPARQQTWLQAALAIDPAVWESETGDGVRYVALVSPLDDTAQGGGTTIIDRSVNPRADRSVRRWLPVEADLSRWAGQTIRVTLQTLPRDDLNYDWAGWGNPLIATRQFDRERPPSGALGAS